MIFMELRCEDSSEEYADISGYNRCWSHDNAGCGVFSHGTQMGAISGARELFNEARKAGWKRMKHGWVCPFCVAQRKKHNV